MTNPRRSGRRATIFASVVFYLVGLIASHAYQHAMDSYHDAEIQQSDLPRVHVPVLDDDGEAIADEMTSIFYDHWDAPRGADQRVPVLLLHGSPGSGDNFALLGAELTSDRRSVYAPDLPGYGYSPSVPSMSHETNAQYMLQMLDQLGIDRVHVVGWSSGGGIALEMAHFAPERVASLTLLASIGAQETEGSGSYFFEHFKYGVGLAVLGSVPELIPHFGLLGDREERTGWLWAFWDSDQRRISDIMGEIEPPTLILHGRHDPLVADWAAERHHEMIPGSRLVMLDASHFLPLLQIHETREHLVEFFHRHDNPGVEPVTGVVDLAPDPDRAGLDLWLHDFGRAVGGTSWWVTLLLLIVFVRVQPNYGVVLATLLMAMMRVDFGVALLAILVGRVWWLTRGAGELDRPYTPLRWTRGILFAVPAIIIGTVGGIWTLSLGDQFDALGIAAGVCLTWAALNTVRLAVTWEGRQRIKGWLSRLTNHEYWPTVVIYAPVLWWGLLRVLSGKGLRPLTAVNPGYSFDGGVREERKSELNDRMGDHPAKLHCALVGPDPDTDARVRTAMDLINGDEHLGGFPIIAKPDQGERGRGVRLLSSINDLRAYCAEHREPFVLQRYHPGPIEIGVLWVRNPAKIAQAGSPTGFIYAITCKEFPELIGDGKRSIRQLIFRHPRYRAQAGMFLNRLRAQQHMIPGDKERLSLGFAGNHAQGAKFTDGGHLITPELSAYIDMLAREFRDERGLGFDIGRFDLRCASFESLKRAEGIGIVELNGLTSEPTNIYDPDRSVFWAWGVLLGYWKHAAELSEARIAHGSGEQIGQSEIRTRMFDLARVMLR